MDSRKLYAAIEQFRTLDPEMPAQTMLIFLIIAEHPGITQTKLVEKLGIAQSSVSRNMYKLYRFKEGRQPGLDLITMDVNPDNFREKVLTLNTKGERFYRTIMSLIH